MVRISEVFGDLKRKAKSVKYETVIELANNYINVLEEKIIELIKDRDKLLESWEFEILKNKKIEKELDSLRAENRSLNNENQALKILVKDLYQELQKLENKKTNLDLNKLQDQIENKIKLYEDEKDQILNQMQEKIVQEKKEFNKIKSLREQVQSALNEVSKELKKPKKSVDFLA